MKVMIVRMLVVVTVIAALAGCGDGERAVVPATAAVIDEYAIALAAKPVEGAVGEVEVVAFTPMVPTQQPALWFSIRKVDGGEATATLGGKAVVSNPDGTTSVVYVPGGGGIPTPFECIPIGPDGTATVILKEPAVGGIYEVTATTVLDGSNPPSALPDSEGNPGALWKSSIFIPVAGPAALAQ